VNNISTEMMQDAAVVFQDSFTHCLSNLIGESKERMKFFIAEILLKEKTFLLPTIEGLPHLISLVFSSAENRDFIFDLHFVFFARFGNSDADVKGLLGNIARGVALSSVNPLNAIPKDINNRLIDESDANDLLLNNQWIAIVLMIKLFISATNSFGKQIIEIENGSKQK